MGLELALALALGFALGWGVFWLLGRRKSTAMLRLPNRLPLVERSLVSNHELEVLKWLRVAFHDHLVMVKVPVLRYTIPDLKQGSEFKANWHELLNGVYCTFLVCTDDGHVVGCIDVPSRKGVGMANRELKVRLLDDCNIAYRQVRHNELPNIGFIRSALLGEVDSPDTIEEAAELGAIDPAFKEELRSFTQQREQAAREAAAQKRQKAEASDAEKKRPIGFNPDGAGLYVPKNPKRGKPDYDDSFIMPMDTRPGKL